jgi:bis(5'-adenosyl)-triphosphatase
MSGIANYRQQVFYSTPLSFAIVNLKPLLPGHVLVSPHRVVPRLTDMAPDEVKDLFTTVQRVQRMLARLYFKDAESGTKGEPDDGGFNIALQDGPDAGQSVPHVHCHIIPRLRGDFKGDISEIYDRLASEEGNVGGMLWDRDMRPKGGGKFPKIEDAARLPRSMEEMSKEAELFKKLMLQSDA